MFLVPGIVGQRSADPIPAMINVRCEDAAVMVTVAIYI